MGTILNDTLNTLIAWVDQMDRHLQEFRDQANTNCKDLAKKLKG